MSNFIVSVETIQDEAPNNEQENKPEDLSINLSVEAVKTEYDSLRTRAARLDNKIYILLTVCAFLFTSFQSIFANFNHKSMPCTSFEVFFLSVSGLIAVLFAVLLVFLLGLLSSTKYNWLDPHEITKGVFMLKKETVADGICGLYKKSWDYNRKILDTRNSKLNICVVLAACVIILLFVMMLFVYFKD